MASRRAFLAGASAAILSGAAPRSAWGTTQADVAIIGAGLAGLAAARLCEAAGLKVVVLEGEPRVGGRLYTLDDMPGRPEAGGIQVGAGYARLKAHAKELGVDLVETTGPNTGRTPGNLYWIEGERAVAETWPSSSANRLDPVERSSEPAALLRRYASAFPVLRELEDWLTAAAEPDISVAQALIAAGASEEARRLIGCNFNGNSLSGMSQLNLARSLSIFRGQSGPISTIAGGAQRLPEAMANSLRGSLRTLARILTIEAEPDRVVLGLTDGSQIAARAVICTVPFSVLRSLGLRAPLAQPMARMIAALPYTRASFAFISTSEAFWLSDGLPATLWSDDPLLGRIFVLSDGLNGEPPMLKLWTTGPGADWLDRLDQNTAQSEIIARLATARPSSSGKITGVHLFSWQQMAGARGIYHHIGTGMARDLAVATREQRARLHFAGEHLAIESSGMEGAIESGERAAQKVLELQG